MAAARYLLPVLILGLLLPLTAQEAPGPEEPPAPRIGEPAPAFELPGTSGAPLRAEEARGGPLLLVFYGRDADPAAGTILRWCRELRPQVEALQARLCLVGPDSLPSHEALLRQVPLQVPLHVDARGSLQADLGLQHLEACLAILDTGGVLVHAQEVPGGDEEGVARALRAALAVIRDLVPPDPPGFVGLVGPPLSRALGQVTLQDARLAVLAGTRLLFLQGTSAREVEIPGGAQAICLDQFGLLYLARGSAIIRWLEEDSSFDLVLEEDPESDEPIRRLVAPTTGALITLRGVELGRVMPATLRFVPLEGVQTTGIVALCAGPGGEVTVVRELAPHLQVVSATVPPRAVQLDRQIHTPPVAAAMDDGGRLYLALQGDRQVHRLNQSGKVVSSFPARGGGMEGQPVLLSAGAGYLDVTIRVDAGGQLRVLRFAP